ncbi:hypothetical protein K491DRAFT_716146 [Lophiostoma macrostomum CBS 122681]|uniref:Apple domain-containing protein n=1 Tax=Lophiostoma macrostomum CBS 122681 TaxID=1314788 RepID=A0A6A6T9N3_9PLEO|nr:hypothetical protein K491DRAFT_716146 [Lophiostoma macrostomum CBS 122681]
MGAPVQVASFGACIIVCDMEPGCKGISFRPRGGTFSPCYLKNEITPGIQTPAVIGAVLVPNEPIPSSSAADLSTSLVTSATDSVSSPSLSTSELPSSNVKASTAVSSTSSKVLITSSSSQEVLDQPATSYSSSVSAQSPSGPESSPPQLTSSLKVVEAVVSPEVPSESIKLSTFGAPSQFYATSPTSSAIYGTSIEKPGTGEPVSATKSVVPISSASNLPPVDSLGRPSIPSSIRVVPTHKTTSFGVPAVVKIEDNEGDDEDTSSADVSPSATTPSSTEVSVPRSAWNVASATTSKVESPTPTSQTLSSQSAPLSSSHTVSKSSSSHAQGITISPPPFSRPGSRTSSTSSPETGSSIPSSISTSQPSVSTKTLSETPTPPTPPMSKTSSSKTSLFTPVFRPTSRPLVSVNSTKISSDTPSSSIRSTMKPSSSSKSYEQTKRGSYFIHSISDENFVLESSSQLLCRKPPFDNPFPSLVAPNPAGIHSHFSGLDKFDIKDPGSNFFQQGQYNCSYKLKRFASLQSFRADVHNTSFYPASSANKQLFQSREACDPYHFHWSTLTIWPTHPLFKANSTHDGWPTPPPFRTRSTVISFPTPPVFRPKSTITSWPTPPVFRPNSTGPIQPPFRNSKTQTLSSSTSRVSNSASVRITISGKILIPPSRTRGTYTSSTTHTSPRPFDYWTQVIDSKDASFSSTRGVTPPPFTRKRPSRSFVPTTSGPEIITSNTARSESSIPVSASSPTVARASPPPGLSNQKIMVKVNGSWIPYNPASTSPPASRSIPSAASSPSAETSVSSITSTSTSESKSASESVQTTTSTSSDFTLSLKKSPHSIPLSPNPLKSNSTATPSARTPVMPSFTRGRVTTKSLVMPNFTRSVAASAPTSESSVAVSAPTFESSVAASAPTSESFVAVSAPTSESQTLVMPKFTRTHFRSPASASASSSSTASSTSTSPSAPSASSSVLHRARTLSDLAQPQPCQNPLHSRHGPHCHEEGDVSAPCRLTSTSTTTLACATVTQIGGLTRYSTRSAEVTQIVGTRTGALREEKGSKTESKSESMTTVSGTRSRSLEVSKGSATATVSSSVGVGGGNGKGKGTVDSAGRRVEENEGILWSLFVGAVLFAFV